MFETISVRTANLGKCTIVKRLDERSYKVETSCGSFRRNRVHLRKTHEDYQTQRHDPAVVSHEAGRPKDATPKLSCTPSAPQIPNDHVLPKKISDNSVCRPERIIRMPNYLKNYNRRSVHMIYLKLYHYYKGH